MTAKAICPQAKLHTKGQPEGYLQWHAWADAKSKTHVQDRCPGCGRLEIWVPKPKRVRLTKAPKSPSTDVKGKQ